MENFSLLRNCRPATLPEAIAIQIMALPNDAPKMKTLWRIFTNMKPEAQQETISIMQFIANKAA